LKTGFIIFLIIAAFVGCIAYNVNWYNSQTTTIITVESKDIKNYDKSSKYLIWSKEGEVFENTDSWMFGKFNSSDLYGKLKIGQKYRVLVVGWRIPLYSMYRNIIEIKSEL
jgi:hypothetical protein